MLERVDDLLVDHSIPSTRAHAEPLLFIHGMWAGSWLFEAWLDFVARAGWEAWALNLRGHSGSRPVPNLGAVSIADYVQDASDVLDKIGPAVVIGYSMGGLIAQVVAARQDVRAAVFMMSAPPRGIVVLRWSVVSRMGRYLRPMLMSRPFELRDVDAAALLFNRVAPAARDAVLPRFTAESGRVAREIALGVVAVDGAGVRCPTLVVGASDDRITPVAAQRRLAKKYGSDYLEAPGHGHMLVLEDGWEAPLSQVLAWLERKMR